MVKTGYIALVSEIGGGFDANRNPIPPSEIVGDYLPCNISDGDSRYSYYEDGQYKTPTYIIVIDLHWISNVPITDNYITLKNTKNEDLGKFQIQNIQYLDLTKRVKIVV